MPESQLSLDDARTLLTRYHFEPTSISGCFDRHESVQFDPLNPMACNHDLVLFARVRDYRLNGWKTAAYRDREIYDGWDKQACLVPVREWPVRRIYHHWRGREWNDFLAENSALRKAVLSELERSGPMRAGDFELDHRRSMRAADVDCDDGSPLKQSPWRNSGRTKEMLRALWNRGEVATHHRKNGEHIYDLTERVIPTEHLRTPALSEREAARRLLLFRHRAAGMLRTSGVSPEVWSLGVSAGVRRKLCGELVAEGLLEELKVDGTRFLAVPELLSGRSPNLVDSQVRFLGPLDPLLWDRTAVQRIFGFEYVWEVYKPAAKRRWGYYVLPVMYGNRFIARFDGKVTDGTHLAMKGFWWEDGVQPDDAMLEALSSAFSRFLAFLNVETIEADGSLPPDVREALPGGRRG